MKKYNTISCEELMTEPMQPLRFFMDGLITSGLYILAGYRKTVQPLKLSEYLSGFRRFAWQVE